MRRTLVTVTIVALVLSGCATSPDSQRTQVEGTALGTGVGAALGALIGGLAGGGRGALIGAGIGAGVGGVTGFMYGTHVANEKEKYTKTEDWLNACIASAQRTNGELKDYNTALASEVQQLDQETQSLATAYAQKMVARDTLASERRKIDLKLAETNKKIDQANFELKNQNQVLAEAQKGGGQPGQTAELNEQIRKLNQSIAELEDHKRVLASMSLRMAV